jgi:DNA-binding beta-propeller fold protein YncE
MQKSPAGVAVVFPFADRRRGSASTITLYIDRRSRARQLLVGLYSDRNGHPASLLAAGSLRSPRAGHWNRAHIGRTSLQPGKRYWIGVLARGGGLSFRGSRHGRCRGLRSTRSRLRSLPSGWIGGVKHGRCPISAFVSGIPTSGPVGKPPTTTQGQGTPTTGTGGSPVVPGGSARYLYTVTEGSIGVFDIDHSFAQVGTISLPQTAGHGVRGVAVNPAGHVLYVSYGGDGGGQGSGSLLAYDLVSQKVLWTQSYSHGVDSMAITPNGKTIYMPDGELSSTGLWHVVDASTGQDTGMSINTGLGTGDNGPHNTIVGPNGQHVYMGDRNLNSGGSNYFYVASTATNLITQKVGPFQSGIRPFTINSSETLVYTSITGLLGFQVGDLTTGKVLDTVNLAHPAGATCTNSGASDPSHGITLSPDDQQLYVLDYTCNYVHVFDTSGAHAQAPVQIAAIPVHSFNPNQAPCTYDCLGDGWLLHSSDGHYVFVGDSGDVIDTTTRSVVAHINQLYQTRVFIEIDWNNGTPTYTTTRSGIGH